MPSPKAESESELESAPEPDAPDKATWPTELHAETWGYLFRRTLHEFREDGGVDAAAGLTFFAVLSVFPAALAVVSLIGVVGDGEAVVDRLLRLLSQVAPNPVVETLRSPLDEIATTSSANAALIVGVLAAVWSASSYVSAFGRAMNRIYEIEEGRPFWKRKPVQLLITVVLIALVMLVAALVVVSGPVTRAVGDALNIEGAALVAWDIAKWPILAAAVVLMIAILYAATPNIQQPRVRWLSLGALLAIILLGSASAGFALYVANFATYTQTFGALAGVIVFLIWVFLVNLALLLGAEFNSELERGRELQAGIEAEHRLRLPPRDTTAVEIARRTARIDEEHGVLLRTGEPLPDRTDTIVPRLRRRITSSLDRARGLVERVGERLRRR